MASRLSLVSRKVKVIQGSPGSESGVKLFLYEPLDLESSPMTKRDLP